ncbi:MAG: hypothetical protein QXE31_03695 [Candidatus Woesearchaeota archaeon]
MLLQYNDVVFGDSAAGLLGLLMGMMVFLVLFSVAVYVYMSLALMKTAQRLNVQNAWLAWIPIANFYLMLKMAKMNPMLMLLIIALIIPFINFFASLTLMVVSIMAQWKICEARQKPGWWAILMMIPIVNFVIWGILAWGK